MSFAALLVLLLHTVANIGLPPVLADHRAVANFISLGHSADRAVATPQEFPPETVRASYAAVITAIARSEWRAPAVRTSALHLRGHFAQLHLAVTAGAVLRASSTGFISSSVDVPRFPYFPTAPPLPG